MIVELFDVGQGFSAFWIEHIASNFYQLAYLYTLFELLQLCVMQEGSLNWLGFWLYFFYFQIMDSIEQGSGTFAMYYLDPEYETLDAEMHPSITYFLGWREHRYRYYVYYPEYTPDFSLIDA